MLTAVLLFGGLLGVLFDRLAQPGKRMFTITRGVVAVSSIGFGAVILRG